MSTLISVFTNNVIRRLILATRLRLINKLFLSLVLTGNFLLSPQAISASPEDQGLTNYRYDIESVSYYLGTGECINIPSALSGVNFDIAPDAKYIANDFSLTTPDNKSCDDYFADVFAGEVYIPAAETVTFYINSDDGSKLWVDDTLVVSNDGAHGGKESNGAITLTEGWHYLELKYFNSGGDYSLNVSYSSNTLGAKTEIPNSALKLGGALDTDNDGTFDRYDTDDDNDGTLDEVDAFPFDATESLDTDNDGIGNNADTDDDNDSFSDEIELASGRSPVDSNDKPSDSDGDSVIDFFDIDDNNNNLIDIRSLADLNEIRNNLDGTSFFGSSVGCLSTCNGFELLNDLDFDTSGNGYIDAEDDYWNDGFGWEPIGAVSGSRENLAFVSLFQGNNYVIKNLMINRPEEDYVALFGYARAGVEIYNLGLIDIRITGDLTTAGLVGDLNDAKVNNVYATGSVIAGNESGGLIGYSENSELSDLYFIGNVTGESDLGGVIGISEYDTITRAFYIGNVLGTGRYGGAGAIVGTNYSDISDVYSVGSVHGEKDVGGVIGHINEGSLDRAYSIAKVTGNTEVGSLIGNVNASDVLFSSSYSVENSDLNAIGVSDIADNSIALTQEELMCPQNAADTSCEPIIYNDWDDTTPVWDFGDSSEFPALVINGSTIVVDDFDNDGIFDSIDGAPLDDSIGDIVPPVITLTGNTSIILSVNDSFVDGGYSALDNVEGDVTDNVVVTGAVNTAITGTYTLSYNVVDSAGNAALTLTRQVTVQDASAPIVIAPSNIVVAAVDSFGTPISASAISIFLESANATDAIDGGLDVAYDAPDVFPLGVTTVYFTAVDTSANVGSAQATVTVVDQEKPVITLTGNTSIIISVNDSFVDDGYSALDNVEGDVTDNVVVTGAVNTANTGTYTLSYNVVDSAGNAALNLTRQVTVQDVTPLDTDSDGVTDDVDAFPDDVNESVDTDGDSIGNNADLDDDNDGIVDVDDEQSLIFNDILAPVFSTLQELTVEATGVLTDVQLVSPVVTDNVDETLTVISDLNGPLGLGSHQITWETIDSSGNQASSQQIVTVVDSSAPDFENVNDIVLNARGNLTNVQNDIIASATDLVDGDVSVSIVGDKLLASGSHQVNLLAVDQSGNRAATLVDVKILPEISLKTGLTVTAGASYSTQAYLSGEAPSYPVEISYQLLINDQIIEEYFTEINSGVVAGINFNVPSTVSPNDDVDLIITSVNNAFSDTENTTTLIVGDNNYAPQLSYRISQQGVNVSIVEPDKGNVTITAFINDINQNDNHDINWLVTDNAFNNLAIDSNNSTFEIDPSLLSEGAYFVNINVVELNTEQGLSTNIDVQFMVENLLALSTDNDEDGDGINDEQEGYADTDGDGIADFLDTDNNPSRLPSSETAEPMQTTVGLTMALGKFVQESYGANSQAGTLTVEDLVNVVGDNAADASITDFATVTPLFNFTIAGLEEQGDSVTVILPLASGSVLPANAIYRKYNIVDGWYTFVEDANNTISSAMVDDNGNCPKPNDTQYILGLEQGNNCIQLLIEDGGPNDADFKRNGSVEDPGTVMVSDSLSQQENEILTLVIEEHFSSYVEGTTVALTANVVNESVSNTNGNVLAYQWQQVSGTAVTFEEKTAEEVSFILPEVSADEIIVLMVTVTDGEKYSSETIELTVINQVNEAIKGHRSSGAAMFWIVFILIIKLYLRLILRNAQAKT